MALTIPNMMAYDPAFAYELAVIIKNGIRRMYVENEQLFYYVTLMNDNYVQAAMPEEEAKGILKGMYKFRATKKPKHRFWVVEPSYQKPFKRVSC